MHAARDSHTSTYYPPGVQLNVTTMTTTMANMMAGATASGPSDVMMPIRLSGACGNDRMLVKVSVTDAEITAKSVRTVRPCG
jgi:hypothetical protein